MTLTAQEKSELIASVLSEVGLIKKHLLNLNSVLDDLPREIWEDLKKYESWNEVEDVDILEITFKGEK